MVNELGEIAWVKRGESVDALTGNSTTVGPGRSLPSELPAMAEPLHESSGQTLETFTYLDWTFTAATYNYNVSPELQELP